MRNAIIALPLLALGALGAETPAPQQQSTLKTASLESHEGMTISALPWTEASQYKEKFPKRSPLAGGVLAVEVVFRNDSNDSLKVNLQRVRLTVQLDTDNRQEIESLTANQVADVVLRPEDKDPTARRKLPIPVGGGGSKGGKDKQWTELQKEAEAAQVPTDVVAPHSTVKGLLYFNLQDQFDLVQTAHLYIPDIALMDKSRSLTYFDIDLSRRGPQ